MFILTGAKEPDFLKLLQHTSDLLITAAKRPSFSVYLYSENDDDDNMFVKAGWG